MERLIKRAKLQKRAKLGRLFCNVVSVWSEGNGKSRVKGTLTANSKKNIFLNFLTFIFISKN